MVEDEDLKSSSGGSPPLRRGTEVYQKLLPKKEISPAPSAQPMSKSRRNLFGFLRNGQKVSSVPYWGQKFSQTNISLVSRLSLISFILLGLLFASILSLMGPSYFYPGTVAAKIANLTVNSLNDQGLKPAMKSADLVMQQIKVAGHHITVEAPISLNALINQPMNLPKLAIPTPIVAMPLGESDQTNEAPLTTELIAETIKDSIDPMITTPQTVLFPAEISLDASVQGTGGQEVAGTVVKVEVEEQKPTPTPSSRPTVSKPRPQPTAVPVKVQPAAFSGNYRWPVTGQLSQRFSRYHPGIDLATKYGTAVFPVSSGVVTGVINQSSGLGKHIIIEHEGGLKSVYAHLSEMKVAVGQRVTQDSLIGAVGLTGRTTGAHLHFEVYQNGAAFNPLGRLLN